MRLRLNKLKNKLLGVTRHFPDQKYKIDYAFTSGQVDYFEMNDIFNMPYQRALKATAAYEEIRMKCTYEYLDWYQKAIANELGGTKFGLKNAARIQTLNAQLGERLSKWAIDLNHVYRLASIVYFDKSEKPEVYDFKYADEKIKLWKKEGIDVFFSQVAIQKLIPSLKSSEINFQVYSEVIKLMETLHLESLEQSLSVQQKIKFKDYVSSLYATETQQN